MNDDDDRYGAEGSFVLAAGFFSVVIFVVIAVMFAIRGMGL